MTFGVCPIRASKIDEPTIKFMKDMHCHSYRFIQTHFVDYRLPDQKNITRNLLAVIDLMEKFGGSVVKGYLYSDVTEDENFEKFDKLAVRKYAWKKPNGEIVFPSHKEENKILLFGEIEQGILSVNSCFLSKFDDMFLFKSMYEYYVYALVDPRPSANYAPFYIGEGANERAKTHLHKKKDSDNLFKDAKISSIRRDGYEPFVDIIISNIETKIEAKHIERQYIRYFGRIKDGGILTNLRSEQDDSRRDRIRNRNNGHIYVKGYDNIIEDMKHKKQTLDKLVIANIIRAKKDYLDILLLETSFLPSDATIPERLHCLVNNITNIVMCSVCHIEPVAYNSRGESGYRKFCGSKCGGHDRELARTRKLYQKELEEEFVQQLKIDVTKFNKEFFKTFIVENCLKKNGDLNGNLTKNYRNFIKKFGEEIFNKTLSDYIVNYQDKILFPEYTYKILNGISLCALCKKEVDKFVNFKQGYLNTCSVSCAQTLRHNPSLKQK